MQWEDFLRKLNNFICQVEPKLVKIILFAIGTYFPRLCKFDNVNVILITLCFESCVLVNCIDWFLKREQYAYHHQWWRSFWNGASIGIFFFMYLLHVGWKDFQLLGTLTHVLYVGVSGVLSVLLGLLCGFFGVLSSLGFALYLFYYKKNGR